MEGYKWAAKRPNEWWYCQTDDQGEPILDDKTYPPSLSLSIRYLDKDGHRVKDISCMELRSHYNGHWPDDPEDESQFTDQIHICDLDDFIEELVEMRDAIPTEVEV